MFRLLRTAAAVGVATVLAGCPDDPLACVDVEPACTPLYPPTWANVYANTFSPSCGLGGASCHAGATPNGGLHLDDEPRAYASLTLSGAGLVVAGDPGCSRVVERMRTRSAQLLMPRGSR